MRIDLKSNPKIRLAAYVGSLGILFGLIGNIYFTHFVSHPSHIVAANTTQQELLPDSIQKENHNNSADKSPLKEIPKDTLLKTNPFLNSNGIEYKDDKGYTSNSSTAGNVPVPAIPTNTTPRPSLGTAPLPISSGGANSVSGAANKNTTAQQGNNKIQGVTTSKNGESMVIMGDGRVLAEGDTFNDGRIAYIGGDGIKLEDGRSIEYK